MSTSNSVQLAEALDLARLASAAYQRFIGYYRQEGGMSAEEADALARAPLRTTADAPSYEVGWYALNGLLDADPELAIAIWQRVKRDAAGYVDQGYHISDALQFDTPWLKAQFVSIRQGFYEEWEPRGGVERALLDTLAAAYCAQTYWLAQTQQRATTDPIDPDLKRRKDGFWCAPRLSAAEAIDQAAQMADRFNRLMMRTLRALRDLRRFTVVINNPQQVNVANQQVVATRIDQ